MHESLALQICDSKVIVDKTYSLKYYSNLSAWMLSVPSKLVRDSALLVRDGRCRIFRNFSIYRPVSGARRRGKIRSLGTFENAPVVGDGRPDTEVAEIPKASVAVEGQVPLVGEGGNTVHAIARQIIAKELRIRGLTDVYDSRERGKQLIGQELSNLLSPERQQAVDIARMRIFSMVVEDSGQGHLLGSPRVKMKQSCSVEFLK